MDKQVSLEDVVSLAKRRGFIFPSSEIYGGLSGVYDYGPLGVKLKHNIQNLWWDSFVTAWDDMYPMDTAILGPEKVFENSGHLANFKDPFVVCANCHAQFRADQIEGKKCSSCGKENTFGEPRQFHMMVKTQLGVVEKSDAPYSFLRPETAQGMFVNFKNILDTVQPNMPFGLAQIGKGFRNEISPRDWLFRLREFEMMEIEYFVHLEGWEKAYEEWRAGMASFFKKVGLPGSMVHEKEVSEDERAHYSKRTIDFEFDFPFGRKELAGLAYRTDYDLSAHEKSGTSLRYQPKDGSEPFIPHVIEPSFGVERLIFAVLSAAYSVDEQGGEKRVFLKLAPEVAPVKVAVFPLLKNKPELVEKARGVYETLKKELGAVIWDDNGNIGKRYRRQDEIGTPHTITIDFQTLDDDTITIRNRDTTLQERVKIGELLKRLE